MNYSYEELDEQVALFLKALFHGAKVADARVEEVLRATRLTKAKMEVLQQLVEAGEPLPLGQLADRLHCGKSNMTALIDRLEADGLVKRFQETGNRRSVFAQATDEGHQSYQAGIQALQEIAREVCEHFTSAERAQCITLLTRLMALWE